MKLANGIELMDLSLFISAKSLLILSDIHIGYESELNRKGILIPRTSFREMIDRIGKILIKTQPKTILITGDLKHSFGSISEQEWRDALRFLDFIGKTAKKIILIKGNHDTILSPIAKKRNVEIVHYYSFSVGKKKIFVCHGDTIPKKSASNFSDADIIIMGHEHPAITISDSIRQEKFKCFLSGKWKGKQLIVMPSANLLTEGTDVLKERLLSPFLQKNREFENFEVYVVGDEEVLKFGKLKNLE